jgi:hypothetical protein
VRPAFQAACILGILAFALCSAPRLEAQSAANPAPDEDPIEWPQFAKDLRRFDIVSFGLFPFAYLVTSIGYDLLRSSQHNWNPAYYPWPMNSGGVPWESEDYHNVIGGSAVVSLAVAASDLTIIWIKRHTAAKKEEARSRPQTEIRRSPLYEE